MAVRACVGAAALVLGLAAGCSDDGGGDDTASTTTTEPEVTTPTLVGDGSAFCDAMLGIGQIERSDDDTPAEVLEQNTRLVGFLDEAQANAPADAPADFEALLDDYRTASQAIAAAEGDLEAAFAALNDASPDVVERLGSSSSHAEAYDFLVTRCGATPP